MLDNALTQEHLITFTNNLKMKQMMNNYRSEYDRIRGELSKRPGNLASATIQRLETRKTELEHLASKLLKK